jgi:hypothetical protein
VIGRFENSEVARLFTVLKRSFVGLLVGYALYVLLVGILITIEDLKYGFSIARGGNFTVWVYPLMSPFLFSRWEWQLVPLEVNLITLFGGLLLVAGVVWANWKRVPR